MQIPDISKGFAGIIGHADIVDHMRNTIRMGRIPHACLLTGEYGAGKKQLAESYAMAIQCREPGSDPCLECPSCRKALSGNHPDILHVTGSKTGGIGVNDIREQVVGDASIRPYESAYKIYIIDNASKMTPQAQNALLKTLEEPPAYIVILLLADNREAMLPTILSRCVELRLKPVSDEEIRAFLMNQMHVPDYQAEIETAFAQGNPGKARMIAESPDFMEMVGNAVHLMKRSREKEIYEMVDAVRGLSAEKQNIQDYLDLYAMWFHDVLLFKATREVDGLIFREDVSAIRERAAVSSYEGLEKILKGIRKAGDRLRANVNFDLTMELLFLTMKEN